MTEKLLQYLWNYKIFKSFDFKDTKNQDLEVLDFGKWNTSNAGPDFLMAIIKLQNITLAGNIELHLRTSDWAFHRHSEDKAYENIILHVVFQHDVELAFFEERNIPTLELKNYLDKEILEKYESLSEINSFIPCEKIFHVSKVPFQFCEENILQKLQEKSIEIEKQLSACKNNYEAVLFHRLAYAFGLKINAEIFQQLAETIDFSVVQKIRQNQEQLEALLFGKAGWLNAPQDNQMKRWKQEYDFLLSKFQLQNIEISPKFLRLRPPNFPTLRLSQLANLYHKEQHLFSRILEAKNLQEIYRIFQGVKASDYWDNRYNFGKISEVKTEKILTKEFVNLVLINAILPLRYTYHKNFKEEITDEVLDFYAEIPTENNHIIRLWKDLGVKISNALESQAFLYQYKNACLQKKCLSCNIGFQLLKS